MECFDRVSNFRELVYSKLRDTADEYVSNLPFVRNRQDLPNVPGLYFCVCNDEIIYIGKSSVSLKNRWSKHKMRAKTNMTIYYHVYKFTQIANIENDEALFIAIYKPMHNHRIMNGNINRDEMQ